MLRALVCGLVRNLVTPRSSSNSKLFFTRSEVNMICKVIRSVITIENKIRAKLVFLYRHNQVSGT